MNVNTISGKEIANNLRAERNRADLTQEQVAKKLDVTLRTYVSYEEDASTIKATTLFLLSKILGCKIDDFYLQNNSTKCEYNILKEKEE